MSEPGLSAFSSWKMAAAIVSESGTGGSTVKKGIYAITLGLLPASAVSLAAGLVVVDEA